MRINLLFGTLFLWLSGVPHWARATTGELQPSLKLEKVVTVGSPAWVRAGEIMFQAPRVDSGLRTDAPLYARIVYLDEGKGLLQVVYRSEHGLAPSSIHTRSSRVGTDKYVASYHELPQPTLAGGDRGGWLTVRVVDGGNVPLTIQSVTVQDAPFPNPEFSEAVAAPWRQPLRFAAPASPPAATLKGRVMVGYQGWFRTPNDRDDRGWEHWFRSHTDPQPDSYTFDMWPDIGIYDQKDLVRAGRIETRGGHPAWLFSSTSDRVVRSQFERLREHGIDGAFLQRFLGRRQGGDDGTPEWVLMNVRRAADATHRLWAVEYDVSGMPLESSYAALQRDWTWLHDVLRVTDDPYYAHEGGKPVVFVWGLTTPDRNFTPAVADQIVDFFRNDPRVGGNYVIGSLPNKWPALSPEWLGHARNYDGVQVWQSKDYAADQRACAQSHQDYYPHVWPGFSWAHLTQQQDPAAFMARAGGTFYRERITQALQAGADRLFVGMFDEYDEGTAILPMSDDPPLPGPPAGRFLTNGNDPPDLWLRITGEAAQALRSPLPPQAFAAP